MVATGSEFIDLVDNPCKLFANRHHNRRSPPCFRKLFGKLPGGGKRTALRGVLVIFPERLLQVIDPISPIVQNGQKTQWYTDRVSDDE